MTKANLKLTSDGNPTSVIGDPMKEVQWVRTSRASVLLALNKFASLFLWYWKVLDCIFGEAEYKLLMIS